MDTKKTVGSRVADLINIKSIVTIALVGTLCALAVRQDTAVSSELLAATVGSVVTYFFTRKGSGDK
jgi:hypothetical protein